MTSGAADSPQDSSSDDQLVSSITSVFTLMADLSLDIPAYQRPYTWTTKNVSELVGDINRFRPVGHYRIGTFILHPPSVNEEDAGTADMLDIIDGQQRFLTFALIATALSELAGKEDALLVEKLIAPLAGVRIPVRKDGRSEKNLRQNYAHLRQVFAEWDAHERRLFAEFFLNECSVVVLRVRDLDAAFQMFDSQNTRGRALYPTDLLKAYHLREFSRTTPDRDKVLDTVREWESVDPAEINHVISKILYRIKMWSANHSVPRGGFTAQEIGLFKGIKEGKTGNGHYRWARHALLAKASVDRFAQENAMLLRHGVVEELEYPFLITQPVIDGEAFFQMVHHYVRQSRRVGVDWGGSPEKIAPHDEKLDEVLEILNQMPRGTGNDYVRALFDCFVIAFTDRFGWEHARSASWVLACQTYLLRVRLARVQAGSVDIHARTVHHRIQEEDENLFVMIAQSLDPAVILSRPAPTIEETEDLPEPLRKLFGQSRNPEVQKEVRS